MIIDKSSYYPKSHLDDQDDEDSTAIIDAEATVCTEAEDPVAAVPPVPQDAGLPEDPDDSSPGAKAVTAVSNLLSWALVPMLMPVYGIILVFGLSILAYTGFGVRLAFTAITAAFNLVVPAIIVLILHRIGFIHDIGLNNREERFVPYVVSILCLLGTALFMWHKGAPRYLPLFFLGGAGAGLVEVIVNRWWKISVHAAGIAGIVALLLYLLIYEYTASETLTWLMIAVGAAGLLGASRIWLGRHTLWQVMAGYAVGFCSVFFIMKA